MNSKLSCYLLSTMLNAEYSAKRGRFVRCIAVGKVKKHDS